MIGRKSPAPVVVQGGKPWGGPALFNGTGRVRHPSSLVRPVARLSVPRRSAGRVARGFVRRHPRWSVLVLVFAGVQLVGFVMDVVGVGGVS